MQEHKNINPADELIINIANAYIKNPKLGQEILISTTTEISKKIFEETNNIVGNIVANKAEITIAKEVQKWHKELR